MSPRAIGGRLTVAMLIGFVALIAAVIAAIWINQRLQDHTGWVVHTYQAERDVANLLGVLERSEAARRGYVLTGDRAFRDTYIAAAGELMPRLERFGAFTADNSRQQARVANARGLLARMAGARTRSILLVDGGRRSEAQASFVDDGSVQTLRGLRGIAAEMAREERTLLAGRAARQRASVNQFVAILGTVAVLLAVVTVVTLLTVRRYLADLLVSEDRLRGLNDTLELQVADRTADLTRANEEIQRFAYIVSHDLRSPLVNVMGFTSELDAARAPLAELIDRADATAPDIITDEARAAAKTDLPEAIGFIRTSTAKMDRLINAILKLSREGRRTITPEPLSLDRIVEGIRDTLQHRLDTSGAEIVVPQALPGIVSDRLAIEQVLGNVIENAVKYLDPARRGRIEVRGRAEGQRALIEVADNGRGIAAADHARVFDLFRRAGTQDQPGEGIGLAHVRALTYRLGGTIDVASALGEGATFRLNLPLRFTEPQGTPA